MKPWLILVGVAAAVGSVGAAPAPAQDDAAWQREWATRHGLGLTADTRGYRYPSAIAFVPEPGAEPDAPLYFVAEIGGTIKVVTNDRSVHTFAADLFKLPDMGPASVKGKIPEQGLTGICLEPEHGYVFASFLALNDKGVLENQIVRFDTEPKRFALKHAAKTKISRMLENQPATGSHMIGPMAVHQGVLYVCVGDAQQPRLSQDLAHPNGKVLRMSFDGRPLPDNPFYADDDPAKPQNFAWAIGFRNPFGLTFARGQMFVTDVGPSVDRIVRVRKGGNYGYDGSDLSISSHADIVFTPSTSPTQIVYIPPAATGPIPPTYHDTFIVVTSGLQGVIGPARHGDKSLLSFRYDFEHGEVIGRPDTLVRYVGAGYQNPVNIAMGPDGLYVVPLQPDADGEFRILRVEFQPQSPHAIVLNRAEALMESRGCLGCHRGGLDAPAPPLDIATLVQRVRKKIDAPEYAEASAAVDAMDAEPFSSWREQRKQVRDAAGIDKVRLWVKYRLLEPRFDNPAALMPNLALTDEEAQVITDYLVQPQPKPTLSDRAKRRLAAWIPHPRQRHIVMAFGAGGAIGVVGGVVLFAIARWFGRRRRGGSSDRN